MSSFLLLGAGTDASAGGGAATMTWDSANKSSAITLSGDLLTANTATNGFQSVITTLPKTSGKRYFETKGTVSLFANQVGLVKSSDTFTFTSGNGLNAICTDYCTTDSRGGSGVGTTGAGIFAATASVLTPTWALNDIVSVAVDFSGGSVWLAINNVWTSFKAASDPGTNANPIFTFTASSSLVGGGAIAGNGGSASLVIAGSGTSLNAYSPPTGFVWWNT